MDNLWIAVVILLLNAVMSSGFFYDHCDVAPVVVRCYVIFGCRQSELLGFEFKIRILSEEFLYVGAVFFFLYAACTVTYFAACRYEFSGVIEQF